MAFVHSAALLLNSDPDSSYESQTNYMPTGDHGYTDAVMPEATPTLDLDVSTMTVQQPNILGTLDVLKVYYMNITTNLQMEKRETGLLRAALADAQDTRNVLDKEILRLQRELEASQVEMKRIQEESESEVRHLEEKLAESKRGWSEKVALAQEAFFSVFETENGSLSKTKSAKNSKRKRTATPAS